MKLIIDIDEELYEAYKGKPPMLGDSGMDMIAQAIANGIPYELKGDMLPVGTTFNIKPEDIKWNGGAQISRENIEKIIVGMLRKWSDGYCYIEIPTEDAIREIESAIDNAPTVSFMISPDYVTELQNHNKELIKQLEEAERPQGNWIEFAHWVAKEVLDDYFEENSGVFAEIACRKLVKLGLVEIKDIVYKMKGSAE